MGFGLDFELGLEAVIVLVGSAQIGFALVVPVLAGIDLVDFDRTELALIVDLADLADLESSDLESSDLETLGLEFLGLEFLGLEFLGPTVLAELGPALVLCRYRPGRGL